MFAKIRDKMREKIRHLEYVMTISRRRGNGQRQSFHL